VILDPESPDQHGPSWSPDGNWIAYRRLNAGKWELAKAPLGGGQSVSLGETFTGGGSETDWSPDGKWICHPKDNRLYLVSADGKAQKMLNTASTAFGFSRDGAILYVVRRRRASREWELAEFTVSDGQEKKVMLLDLPSAAEVAGFSLNPDGKSFATSTGVRRHDIWLLDGFPRPGLWRW
jgi:Tol biopolymer transport system component